MQIVKLVFNMLEKDPLFLVVVQAVNNLDSFLLHETHCCLQIVVSWDNTWKHNLTDEEPMPSIDAARCLLVDWNYDLVVRKPIQTSCSVLMIDHMTVQYEWCVRVHSRPPWDVGKSVMATADHQLVVEESIEDVRRFFAHFSQHFIMVPAM